MPSIPINLCTPPPPSLDQILTRNQSKESLQTFEHQKKAGKKSNRELRDEAAAKEMALGTQQPMDSFFGKSFGNNEKNQNQHRG